MNKGSLAGCIIGTVLLLLCSSGGTTELFLKAEPFQSAPNSELLIAVFNGSIDKSKYSTEFERLESLTVTGDSALTSISEGQWETGDTVSFVRIETGNAGTRLIGISTRPRSIEFSPDQFAEYLRREGLEDDLARFEQRAENRPVRERYSKHAKAVVQVGEERTGTYRKVFGHPLEIILDTNPYEVGFGDEIGFQVLVGGKPAANRIVRAGCEGFHGHDASGTHLEYHTLRTDEDGTARFLISQKGVWYISLIDIREARDADADFESNWATITFDVI